MYELEVKAYRHHQLLNNFSDKGNGVFVFNGSYKECNRLLHKLVRRGYKARMYKKEYARSNNYRYNFFNATGNKKEYRCVYCGRVFKKDRITIDHVIPVDRAKSSFIARTFLKLKGCKSVNEIDNLVPACSICNSKKGTHIKLKYLLRSQWGEYRSYWIVMPLIKISITLFILAICYMIYINPSILEPILEEITNITKDFIEKLIPR